MTAIKDFYLNQEPNDMGLYLKDIWNFSAWEFENTHDFIQWLFPIEYQSIRNPLAPTITKTDLQEISSNSEIRENLMNSLFYAENFWGLDVKHQKLNRTRPRSFKSFDELNWPIVNHHNYLRITRTLHCLKLFGLEKEAIELLNYLESDVYQVYQHVIGDDTLSIWKHSVADEIEMSA